MQNPMVSLAFPVCLHVICEGPFFFVIMFYFRSAFTGGTGSFREVIFPAYITPVLAALKHNIVLLLLLLNIIYNNLKLFISFTAVIINNTGYF